MPSSRAKAVQQTATSSSGTITVPLRDIAQLLDPDPAPFREGVVTPEAEDYILKAAKKLPGHVPLRIVVDLPGGTEQRDRPILRTRSAVISAARRRRRPARSGSCSVTAARRF